MEQGAQTERVKKKVGRPKGTGLFTEEEKQRKSTTESKNILLLKFWKKNENENDYNIKQKILKNCIIC